MKGATELDIDRKMKKNHDKEDILILYQKIISEEFSEFHPIPVS